MMCARSGRHTTFSCRGERKALDAAPERPSRDTGAAGGLFAHSEAVRFLLDPPARGQGITNDALTKVAGYYARLHREARELYDYHVNEWIAKVDPAYEDKAKTVESLWNAEHSTHARLAPVERGEGRWRAAAGQASPRLSAVVRLASAAAMAAARRQPLWMPRATEHPSSQRAHPTGSRPESP